MKIVSEYVFAASLKSSVKENLPRLKSIDTGIPFFALSTELANYKSYYEKYSNLLTSSNDKIKVYPIGE